MDSEDVVSHTSLSFTSSESWSRVIGWREGWNMANGVCVCVCKGGGCQSLTLNFRVLQIKTRSKE